MPRHGDPGASSERAPLLAPDGWPNDGSGRTTPEPVDEEFGVSTLPRPLAGGRAAASGGSSGGGTNTAASVSWPFLARVLYYLMFVVLMATQIFWAAMELGSEVGEKLQAHCVSIYSVLCLRYLPLAAVLVCRWMYGRFCSAGESSVADAGNAPPATQASAPKPPAPWKAGSTVMFFRALSMPAIFYTGLAKFDFGHCGFFMLGLWIARFGIRSRSVPRITVLCKVLLFIVYAMNFPWVDEPGMWKSFGVTSIDACGDEDPDLLSYSWRTFGWPVLAVFTTTYWAKAVEERTEAVKVAEAEKVERVAEADDQGVLAASVSTKQDATTTKDNINHICATGVLLATVYLSRSGSTILQTVTLFLAGILLTWKRTTLCGCRAYTMNFTQFWLVTIIVAKYCYKSSLFRLMFRTHVFSATAMLSWLGRLDTFREWAPEYTTRNLLDDIGLFTNPPDFWSASGGALPDVLVEMVALVLIGALLRSNNKSTGTISVDPFQFVVAWVDKKWEEVLDDRGGKQNPIAEWCCQHAVLFKKDFKQALRVACIAVIVWMGTYELSLFNFVYFALGATLTFAWGHNNNISNLLACNFFGKFVPLVHLTSVYVFKLQFWQQAFPAYDDSDGSILPLETTETFLGCDAGQTFTWIGLRGEVMSKNHVNQQYEVQASTYVPLLVMLSLALHDWLSQDPCETDETYKEKEPESQDGEAYEEDEIEPAAEEDGLLWLFALIRDKYTWLRDTITEHIFGDAFYALLILTPVLRGQVDLVSGMYLFLLVCFTQSSLAEEDTVQRGPFYGGIVSLIGSAVLGWAMLWWFDALLWSWLYLIGLGLLLILGCVPLRKWLQSACRTFAKDVCSNQMGLLFVVLCIRYAVYLGRPPDCSWLSKSSWLYQHVAFFIDPERLVTRNAELRVWLGIANECVTNQDYYRPCPVLDLFLKDYVILLFMACYTRWTKAANELTQTTSQKETVPRYGDNWVDHLLCLLWHSGGVFVLQTGLLYGLLCLWAGANVKQGTSIWLCLFTWLILRTFRHETAHELASRAGSELPDIDLLRDDAKVLFRWACGAMFFYALTQPPLGPAFLGMEWVDWTYNTNCETRVWKALMVLAGVPLETITHSRHDKSLPDVDTSYLTVLATTALIALSLKTLLRQSKRHGVVRDQHARSKDRTKDASDASANHVRRAEIVADVLLSPRVRSRADSTSAIETVSAVFENIHAYVHHTLIDKLIHDQDSHTVLAAALENAKGVDSSLEVRANTNPKLLAQVILGCLSVVLLYVLGVVIYSWTPVFGGIYLVLLSVLLTFCLFLFVVLFWDLRSERLEEEDKFAKDWISSVIDYDPKAQSERLSGDLFGWLAKELGVKLSKAGAKAAFRDCMQEGTVNFDRFFSWYEEQVIPDFWYEKLQEGDKRKRGRNALEYLTQKSKKKLVEDLPDFRKLQENKTIYNELPGVLQSPAAQFGRLADSLAFALANGLVSFPSNMLLDFVPRVMLTRLCAGYRKNVLVCRRRSKPPAVLPDGMCRIHCTHRHVFVCLDDDSFWLLLCVRYACAGTLRM